MQRTKPRALVETAMMTAIATILCVAIYFLPLFAILNVAVPAPMALIGKRHGVKWSILCAVATGLLINLFMGPLQALFEIGTFGVVGILLGLAYRRGWGAGWRLLGPSLIFVASVIAQFYVMQWVMGVDLLATMQEAYQTGATQMATMMQQMKAGSPDNAFLNPAAMAQVEEMQREGWKQMLLIMPAGIIVAGFVISFANNLVCEKIFKRMHIAIPNFPPLVLWRMPRWTILVFAVAALGTWWASVEHWELIRQIGANVNLLAVVVLWLEGLAFGRYLFLAQGWSNKIFIVLVVLSFFLPFLTYMLVGAGLMELILQIRKREGLFDHTEEVLARMKLQ